MKEIRDGEGNVIRREYGHNEPKPAGGGDGWAEGIVVVIILWWLASCMFGG